MISVIIPTLNAEGYLPEQLKCLKSQNIDAETEIIIIDSESDDRTCEIAREEGATVIPILRKDFDHGGTRNIAYRASHGDIVCYLTQDAIPADENYLSELLKGFDDPEVMMISGRQVPKADANPVERLTREFNYPDKTYTRSKEDISTLGIKAYFFSDACSAYRRSILDEMGGFESPILTNEDMLMAARVINAGYRIGYAGSARVYHSHNFKLSYQYRRNFDVAVFLKQHEAEIDSGSTTGEGIRMVLYTIKELIKHGHILSVFRCIGESGAKFLGNRAGRRYEGMTREKILARTTNKGYWKGKTW